MAFTYIRNEFNNLIQNIDIEIVDLISCVKSDMQSRSKDLAAPAIT